MQISLQFKWFVLSKCVQSAQQTVMDKFVLKGYRPLPRKICNLWEDIQDIIGPVKK